MPTDSIIPVHLDSFGDLSAEPDCTACPDGYRPALGRDLNGAGYVIVGSLGPLRFEDDIICVDDENDDWEHLDLYGGTVPALYGVSIPGPVRPVYIRAEPPALDLGTDAEDTDLAEADADALDTERIALYCRAVESLDVLLEATLRDMLARDPEHPTAEAEIEWARARIAEGLAVLRQWVGVDHG